MAKLKVNSYETYEDFVKWADEELSLINAGDLNFSIKPLDFRDCIFGLYKYLIEEATEGNKPKNGLSLGAVERIGREISHKLDSIYSSNEETNKRNKLHSAHRYYHLSNGLDTKLDDIITLCNLIVSYPAENRTMLANALKKSTYISYSRFGGQDMYFVVQHFLDNCTELGPETHRYLLTPQYIIADMLKIGSDLKQLASKVQPLTKLKAVENSVDDSVFFKYRALELPYQLYYNIVVSMIKHKVRLDAMLADTEDKSNRAFVELRNLSKFKEPFATISLSYMSYSTVTLFEEALNVKGIGNADVSETPGLQFSDLYLQRYGDSVRHSIYDYFLDSEKTKEVCSITTISTLETHVYRGVSKDEFENYVQKLRNYLCIKEVTIEDEFRGRGLFRQILDNIKEEAKKEGITKIVLQPYPLNSKNKAAKSMEVLQKDLVEKYSHLGFKVAIEGEIGEGGTKLMLMELSLENEGTTPQLKTSSIFS